MDRTKSRFKTPKIVAAYSSFVIVVFAGFVYLLIQLMNKNQSLNFYLYALSPNNIIDGEISLIDPNRVISSGELYARQVEGLIKLVIPFLLATIFIVIVINIIFILKMNKMIKEKRLEIAKAMGSMDLSNDQFKDPLLQSSYRSIKDHIDNNIADFQRLHNYLAHEQKNSLAMMRVQAEMQGNYDLLSKIDFLTDGINDILTISESSNNQTLYPIDLGLICAQVVDQYRQSYSNITFSADFDLDYTILGKERWMMRAISNLVSNAVKYGDGNQIEIEVRQEKGSTIIAVKDQGVGIEPSRLGTIFDYAYRVNELKEDGFGIGLSVVSHVCDLCGGFASVESEISKGSTFYLSFPNYR